MAIIPRYTNNCNDFDSDCNYGGTSPWYNYGRWILLGAIVIGAFLIFVIFSCITARRRRRFGNSPYRGTGWAAGRPPPGHAPAQYTGAPPQPYFANNNQAPPVYSPPVSNQGYYNQGQEQNQGYFGSQQQGVELQQPESAYTPRGGEPVYNYAPPMSPPPGKKGGDGIIR
ncbi:hypothetical protein IMSHALPRED_007886 [Imshaugia aleurites]|uniref:Uncharacterized protein n=1 Tax=Imshaugia aleurites TaxID=172621 RepID=A0A8H3IIK6_9LECA|nr:hypothetical protein IMSHALPRED_007886 [Imshaugia aleurites]